MAPILIFCEGSNDDALLRKIINHFTFFPAWRIQSYAYAQERLEKVKDFIRNAQRAINQGNKNFISSFIFTSDADFVKRGWQNNRKSIQTRLAGLNSQYGVQSQYIVLVVDMLESWLVAGLDQNACSLLGINYVVNTESYTKTHFKNDYPKIDKSEIIARSKILEEINFEYAKRNESYSYFVNTLVNI